MEWGYHWLVWEGDTLVVESTNFVDKTHYRWDRLSVT